MQIIKTILVAALAVTTSVAAALPDATADVSVAHSNQFHSEAFIAVQEIEKKQNKRDQDASLKVEITDPAFWDKLTCIIECRVLEQQCVNSGISQPVCANNVCRNNEEYVS